MAAFGSLTLSWVWAHHACCLTRSANSDIPILFNFQPVPQLLLLTKRRHSITSFGTRKPSQEVFLWFFWHLFPSNFETSWVPFSSKWGFTLMPLVTMNVLHLVVGMPRDVVWRQTRHVSKRLLFKSCLPLTGHPSTALAASKVLVNVVHTLRDHEARVRGWEYDTGLALPEERVQDQDESSRIKQWRLWLYA